MADMARLERELRSHFGDEDGGAIAEGNARRVLRAGWGGKLSRRGAP